MYYTRRDWHYTRGDGNYKRGDRHYKRGTDTIKGGTDTIQGGTETLYKVRSNLVANLGTIIFSHISKFISFFCGFQGILRSDVKAPTTDSFGASRSTQ